MEVTLMTATTEMTREESLLASQAIFEKLSSADPSMAKQAVDAVNDFTRTKMREDGFFRRIMPPIPISNDDLDRQVDTDKPVKIVDKEPNSPAAVSIPFATLPTSLYIKGDRYKVTFDRITTPKFTKDVDELRTWYMDIRQVFSDNAIKDMLAEEDGKFLSAVNTALVGPDLIVPTSGVAQYQTIAGGITRDTLWDSLKILPGTPSNLEVHCVLLNNITIKDVAKFTRNEMGGDLAEEIMRNGWTLSEVMGVKWVITIKKGLVPTNTMYHFADPKFIGKSYMLEDTTMYIRREAYFIEFFAYESLGGTIGHTSGLARVDFE
jgi:hypothetical protein